MTTDSMLEKLGKKGVKIPSPESVFIGDDVDVDRISGKGVVLYPGCRIYGAGTLILDGARLGVEAPVTVQDCYIGPDVQLKGGFFSKSVFLEKVEAGSGAHVREGCILEEEASIAHTVGLKQTILFPFVTLGSLINFCDCLMSGGTSRSDHSEVGSSYIHFNYTPNQDKATASLLGDVPRGVMLNQPPVFLGGQGGLVGPCRLEFGTVVAAGSVVRKDELRPGRLIVAGSGRDGNIPFSAGIYRNMKRILSANFIYIANLIALRQWYVHVRTQFISDRFPAALPDGLLATLDLGITERIKRLEALSRKMPKSIELYRQSAGNAASETLVAQKQAFYGQWPDLEMFFRQTTETGEGDRDLRDRFLEKIAAETARSGKNYIPVIQALDTEDAATGTAWLRSIVDRTVSGAFDLVPEYGKVKSL